MIAVHGAPGDETTALVLEALARRGAPVSFINQAEVLSQSVHFEADSEVRGNLELGDRTIDLRDVTAAYLRPYDSADAPAVAVHGALSPEGFHARQVDSLMLRWGDVTPALVINRPSAMASNDSKPFQARAARAAEFMVPDTLLTTEPQAARDFHATHGDVVFKSISSVRSIATRLDDDALTHLDDVRWCPTQFQEHVPGTDVRVHVVGRRTFACEIESDADDYRYGNSTMRPYNLPAEVAGRCLALAMNLGLEVTGIDLRRTPDERWYCFEANPSPAFAHFGEEIASLVSDAVADHLITGAPTRPLPFAQASGSAPSAPEVQPDPSEPEAPAEPAEPEVPAEPSGRNVPEAPAEPDSGPALPKPEPTTREPQRSPIDDTTQASPIPSPTAKEPTMSTIPTPAEPEKTLIQKIIPKQTDPLGKFIRTGEGWLVFAFNLALLIVPIVTSSLSPATAVEWAAILNGVTVVARSGLKIAAVVGTPPSPVSQKTTSEIDAIAEELAQQLPELLDRGGARAVPSAS